MTDQEKASEYLTKMAEALKLKGENVFKIRAFEKAAPIVLEQSDLHARARAGTLTEIAGIGKGIAEILTGLLIHDSDAALKEIYASLPAGLLALTAVPGLGPKKAIQVIEELGIQSLRELEYACTENRLLHLKGFGEKNQAKILEGVRFLLQAEGQARFADQEDLAEALLTLLREKHPKLRMEWTGDYRRKLEVLNRLELLVQTSTAGRASMESTIAEFREKNPELLPVLWVEASAADFETTWFQTTASPEFLSEFIRISGPIAPGLSEAEIFQIKKLPVIEPAFRETAATLTAAQSPEWKNLCHDLKQIQGIFHNHTTASDGNASLEQMVQRACELGYRYIGITEHSESAFYAQGLKKDDLKKQRKEIDRVQKKFPDIRIYWGIESDILQDGGLDYSKPILSEFDFVIGSIHSRFAMDSAAMTERLVRAIQNPATTMIGHLTGRLLLGRPGYSFDWDQVLKAAADHDVVVEINSHPARLDIDWRHGPELRAYKIKVSINPDAHELKGLEDTRFGLTVAQKALIPRAQILNTWDTAEIDRWFSERHSGK